MPEMIVIKFLVHIAHAEWSVCSHRKSKIEDVKLVATRMRPDAIPLSLGGIDTTRKNPSRLQACFTVAFSFDLSQCAVAGDGNAFVERVNSRECGIWAMACHASPKSFTTPHSRAKHGRSQPKLILQFG